MAKIQYIKDKNGVNIYPVTHEKAVRDSSGNNIQSKIGNLQDLTTTNKSNLVSAINEAASTGGGTPNAVQYVEQSLTSSQKAQVRSNIGACSSQSSGSVEETNLGPNVRYTQQSLTAAQKTQARTNIGAGTSSFSGSYDDLTNKPTIAPLSNNLQADKESTTKGASAKDAYDAAHPAIATSIPSGGMKPNVFYNLGTLTGNVTFTLAEPTDATIVNHYFFSFTAGDPAPTITWPSGIVGWASGIQPTITAMVYYEISILNGYAAFLDV